MVQHRGPKPFEKSVETIQWERASFQQPVLEKLDICMQIKERSWTLTFHHTENELKTNQRSKIVRTKTISKQSLILDENNHREKMLST